MSDAEVVTSEPAAPPRGPRRRTQAIIALGAAVVLAAVLSIVFWNRSSTPGQPQTTPAPGNLLGADGQQLATLLTDARNHTFHVKYAVHGDAKLIGGTLVMEWWNKPGHSRVDTTRTRAGQTVHTASIVNGNSGVGCQKIGSGSWTCSHIDVPAPGDPNGMIATLTGELSGRPISEHPGKVLGKQVSCFHVGGGTEPIDVCTNSDGVLLRNESAKVTYEASTLDTDVPDSVFDTPS